MTILQKWLLSCALTLSAVAGCAPELNFSGSVEAGGSGDTVDLSGVGDVDIASVVDTAGVDTGGMTDGSGVDVTSPVDVAESDLGEMTDGGVVDVTSPMDDAGSDMDVSSACGTVGLTAPDGFACIPKGKFQMGSDPDSADEGLYNDDDEAPVHTVTITRDFWLAKTEVTQEQWEAVFEVNPSEFQNCGLTCPVENVTWFDALEYCNRLSEKAGLEPCYDFSGLDCSGTKGDGYVCTTAPKFKGLDCTGYRLPTEAEWEYAARAGTTTALYTGDIEINGEFNAPNLGKIGWYGGNSGVDYEGGSDCSTWSEKEQASVSCGTHPAAQKGTNSWGLSDMLGNVWEWTWDWHGSDYYGSDPTVDPLGPEIGVHRVCRGGSWYNSASKCRAANREWYWIDLRYGFLGLRPARSIP